MHLSEVIKRPVITEASTIMAEETNQFMFEVDMKANKIQIKQAIMQLYPNVDVISVNTLIMPKKRGRRGSKAITRSVAWKKAIVKLPAGQTIPEFSA